MLAPIALFVYGRPGHARRTIESLKANPLAKSSELYIFADGARSTADATRVAETRSVIREVCAEGFKRVHIAEQNVNRGLSRSIVSGVGEVLEKHGRVVVLEDDLLLSPTFLQFVNQGLTLYENDDAVASIHGYCYPVDEHLPETFFLQGADCWGWATWARAWQHFESDGSKLLAELRKRGLSRRFDLDGAYPYTRMLKGQIAGRNDSWAIRWHASCFLAGRLTLYPGRSLVDNIGNDSSGTHCGATDAFSGTLDARAVDVRRIDLAESATARQAFVRFLRRQRSPLARARRTWTQLQAAFGRA